MVEGHNPEDMVLTLNASEAYFRKVVGYCHYHKCFVTCTQHSRRKCNSNGCPNFEKNPVHPYWKHLETRRLRRKGLID